MIAAVIAGALIGALVAVAVIIGVRRRRIRAVEREAVNVAVYREQQTDLQQALARGDIDEADYDAAQADLDRRLVSEAAPDEAAADAQPMGLIAAVVLVLVVVVTVPSMFMLSHGAQHFAAPPAEQPTLEQMVSNLAQRMNESPDDVDGWVLLGRSYTVMERYKESAQAYARANELTGGAAPDLLVAEGEALALARDRDLQGRPSELFDKALAIDPTNIRGLWYAAMAAQQRGDADGMHERLAALDGRPDLPPELQAVITEELGGTPASAAVSTASAAGIVIDVSVTLAPNLLDKVPDGAVLFVYAKAQAGPPMPLAVQRLAPGEWPRQVQLTEAMAMMPGMSLSKFNAWTVGARLSGSGGPIAQPGDLQGEVKVDPSMLGAPVTVTIADVVGTK